MRKRLNSAGMMLACAVLVVPVAAAAAPAELPELPEHAAEKVAAAHAKAAKAVGELKGEGRGLDPDRARGIARAQEVSNSWVFGKRDKPGNGVGPMNSQGRAKDVHDALAEGLSPSRVDGELVSERAKGMGKAFRGLKSKWEGHPGKGQGKGLGGPGGGEDDADD